MNFHVWEPQTELFARQCIMLLAMTEPNCAFTVQSKKGYPYCDFFCLLNSVFNRNMENLTKAELYLDLLGNCQNRQITADYIHQKSSVLSEMITDFEYRQNQATFISPSCIFNHRNKEETYTKIQIICQCFVNCKYSKTKH